MKKFRIISAFMSFVMIIGVLANLTVLPVFGAANTNKETEETTGAKSPDYYKENYLERSFSTAAQKIKTMNKGVPMLQNDKYNFYVQKESGEWALENKVTGQFLFSNPYGVGGIQASDDTKMSLLSQVLISYSDSGVSKSYTSYKDCVMLGQIKVKNLKNGVRVEYAVGNEETRMLLPMQITDERFMNEIFNLIPDEINGRTNRDKYTLESLYQKKDLNDSTLTNAAKKDLVAKFPIVEKYPIRVFSTDAKENEMRRMETLIKTYCPGYSFEELEYDHSLVGYVAKDKAPAVFKFALEYTLTDEGVDMRLGANGIRFDESVYTLESMKILPYVGAGSSDNTGYIFMPDGSGAIIRFEDVAGKSVTISGKLYGQDYAFHTITGSTQQTMRFPVYGVVETGVRTEKYEVDGKTVVKQFDVNSGYLAIVTEGDSLATLYAETGGALHKYNTAYTSFNPRPSDQYNLADSISVGSNATWTVVSDRKYTGSYRIKYVMLEDQTLAAQNAEANEGFKSYDATYVGMAKAYRDYLYGTEQLVKLDESKIKENIPLYIEALGTIDTTEKFLSFPVTVEKPLTTFDDLLTMHSELGAEGISNINFKLTGFANGGISSTVPSQVKFQKKTGGNKAFTEMVEIAEEKGFGLYPDFDFNYVYNTSAFDGFSYKDDAVRTIDNRYTQKKKYDNVYQTLMETGNVVISVSAFSDFYKGFNEDLQKLGATSVSVGSLGSDLNSDFDEDDPYNREDARYETVKLLKNLKEDYTSVMSNAGNAYVLAYVDHLLNVSLDSSRYILASQSVPFMGMVLHGAVEFAGTPLNTTGNIAYEMLKMIENGANPYFLLAYENTAELKDDPVYAQYFSVTYKIWKEDLVGYYNVLNEALNDVQSALIVDHEFVQGERIPTEQEIEEDAAALLEAQEKAAINKVHEEEKERRAAVLAAKLEAIKNGEQNVQNPDNTTDTSTGNSLVNPDTRVEEAEPEEEEELIDLKTKYLTKTGTVVKVTYSNGKVFILNYNSFDITVNGRTVKALGFIESTVAEEEKFVETETEEVTEAPESNETPETVETTDPAETTGTPEETGAPESTGTPEETAQN